jgi:hypothetical protein
MDVDSIDPVAVYAALMATLIRTVFAQPNAALAWAQHALLSTSGRFGAAQPVGVGDLDLSCGGGSSKMLTWGRANGSAPVS